MSKDLNLCQFIGRLGKEPTIRYTSGGKAIASVAIACSDDYKVKQGNKVEQTNWINIVAFDKLAEIIERYVNKGSQVYVSGKFTVRKWQDSSANDRYTTEIVANDLQMLGGKQQQNNAGQVPAQQNQPQNQFDDFDDDIPFN